ncbi:uncharacterized protein LOC111087501 [Limulus polyphemus]|uniref:Uncharacterized protein LOC111087501 n=1 Tax=Limulus polyphemus TaxID=6850 RepID=A0ABM1T2C4_LIMPO|nr:uncharacterized protein LOC111087501 [Limulus polyphemus]XP_022250031.1 uncharacterized protein LOC111087501 [Limulus polyphemus]
MDRSSGLKRPRLDSVQGYGASNFEETNQFSCNEELWGDEEMTAEEFDLLESQVMELETQKTDSRPLPHKISDQTPSVTVTKLMSSSPPGFCTLQNLEIGTSTSNNLNQSNELVVVLQTKLKEHQQEISELKNHQYVQEGQLSMLRTSLEQRSKELDQERLERECLLDIKLQEQKQEELKLKQQIEKLQTELHFKDQEIREALEKIQALDQRCKHKLNIPEEKLPLGSSKSSQKLNCSSQQGKACENGFLARFSSMTEQKSAVGIQTEDEFVLRDFEKFSVNKQNLSLVDRLLASGVPSWFIESLINHKASSLSSSDIEKIHFNKALLKPISMLPRATEDPGSRLLIASLFPSVGYESMSSYLKHMVSYSKQETSKFNCISVHVDILEVVVKYLQEFLESLNTSSFPIVSDLGRIPKTQPTSASATQDSNSLHEYKEVTAVFGLQTVVTILSSLSPHIGSFFSSALEDIDENGHLTQLASSANLFTQKDNFCVSSGTKLQDKTETAIHRFILLLLRAANPQFLNGELVNQTVLEWSLMVLLSIVHSVMQNGGSVKKLLCQLDVATLVSGSYGIEMAWITLNILVCALPERTVAETVLRHCSKPVEQSCVFKNVSELCNQLVGSNVGIRTDVVSLIIDFISKTMSTLGFDFVLSTDCCAAGVMASIMRVLHQELENFQVLNTEKSKTCLKKGISLLALVSRYCSSSFSQLCSTARGEWANFLHDLMIMCASDTSFKQNVRDDVQELWNNFATEDVGEIIPAGCSSSSGETSSTGSQKLLPKVSDVEKSCQSWS